MNRNFSDVIQAIRIKALLTQEAFAVELGVAPSTVNRWETGKAGPNLSTMKKIKLFCAEHDASYEDAEQSWISYKLEERNNGRT